jgi:hypothetical protein
MCAQPFERHPLCMCVCVCVWAAFEISYVCMSTFGMHRIFVCVCGHLSRDRVCAQVLLEWNRFLYVYLCVSPFEMLCDMRVLLKDLCMCVCV